MITVRQALATKAMKGHVCFYCHPSQSQTPDNPVRTDFCALCGHRGDGIMQRIKYSASHYIWQAQQRRQEEP